MSKRITNLTLSIFLMLIGFAFISPGEIFSQEVDKDLWQTNANVSAFARDGSTLYLGGSFTMVGPSAPNFTGLDLATAQPDVDLPPVDGEVRAIVSDGEGGWYIGGNFSKVGDSVRNKIAHVRSDKTVGPWNPGTNWVWSQYVNDIEFSNNTVYFGGAFQINISGEIRNNIAAVDTDGNIVTNWNAQVEEWWTVSAIEVADTIVFFGGTFTSAGGETRNRVAALSVNGNLLPWNPNANSEVISIAVRDTVVYVGGRFSSIGGESRERVAAIGFSGTSLDWIANTNAGSVTRVYSVSVYDTTIYLGGNFTSINGIPRTGLAAVGISGNLLNWAPTLSSGSGVSIYSIQRDGDKVYVGGTFTDVNGVVEYEAEGLVAFDATSGATSNWKPGLSNTPTNPLVTVKSLLIDNNTLYVGGSFNMAGGKSRHKLAAVDLTTNSLLPLSVNIVGSVTDMVLLNGNLYFGGSITKVNNEERSRLAAIDPATGDLLNWNPNAGGNVMTVAVKDTTIYIGGAFTSMSGITRNRLAAVSESGTLLDWNPNASSTVNTLLIRDTVIYVGGQFTTLSGESRNRLGAVSTSGNLLDWDPNSGGTVNTLADQDSVIYVGGAFTSMSGESRNRFAAVGVSGSLLPLNIPANSTVNKLLVAGDNLYLGGNFTTLNGNSRIRLGSIDLTSETVTNWAPEANSAISSIGTFQQSVYVGGGFTAVNNETRRYFALLSDTSLPLDVPVFTVTPSSVDFGDVLVGNSADDSVVVTNAGNQLLTIASVSSTNGSFSVIPNSGDLSPNESLTFYITFEPENEGEVNAEIKFEHNATGSPSSVSVTGSGIEPPPTLGQTIFTGLATLDSSYAAPGTVIRAYRKETNTLINSTEVVPLNEGVNYAISLLEGAGGIEDGDTVEFRIVGNNGIETELRYDPAREAAIFTAVQPPEIVEYNLHAAHQRTISLPVVQGYNAVSWNVYTENNNVSDVFSDLLNSGKVQIILDYINEEGETPQFSFYIPALGQYNPFQSTDFRKGYFVKLYNGSESDEFTITGRPVAHNIPIPLNAGYNFISYLPERSNGIEQALSSLNWSNIGTVLEYVNLGTGDPGDEYFNPYPQGGEFQTMHQGGGYFVQLGVGKDTLVYNELYESPIIYSPSDRERLTQATTDEFPMVMFAYGTEVTYDGELITEGSVLTAKMYEDIICGEAVFAADGIVGIAIHKPENMNNAENNDEIVRLYLDGELVNAELLWNGFGAVHKLDDLVTSVNGESMPSSYALYQNYPNPFNPETEIKFDLPQNSIVNITIYNMLGQKVKTLVDTEMAPGYHSVKWNGTNHAGAKVASGIYIYRLQAASEHKSDYIRTLKMILMK